MKKKKILTVVAVLIVVSLGVYFKSCTYIPIAGTVVDAETKQPIEGAVVLAEWTITPMAWIGLPTTYSYKVIETASDKNGKFTIAGYILNPIVNKPRLTIYKAGYVCWNNEYIFPGKQHRYGFRWANNITYELEKFKKSYSYAEHVSFVGSDAFLKGAEYFRKNFSWELDLASKELSGGK